MTITVYTKERGVRRLKKGVTLAQYQIKHPDAIRTRKPPSLETLEEWSCECGCEALDGCWVEEDGECEHGYPSWMIAMGYI